MIVARGRTDSFINSIIIIYQDWIGIIRNVIVFLLHIKTKDQVITNVDYTSKMVIPNIKKRFKIIVSRLILHERLHLIGSRWLWLVKYWYNFIFKRVKTV